MTLVRTAPRRAAEYREACGCTPDTDITENNDGFTLTLDLPGLGKDEVSVKVNDGILTVSGERTREEAEDQNHYHHYERPTGPFERSFRLPDYIDSEHITAKNENGVLTLSLPKKEEAKPHTVKVK